MLVPAPAPTITPTSKPAGRPLFSLSCGTFSRDPKSPPLALSKSSRCSRPVLVAAIPRSKPVTPSGVVGVIGLYESAAPRSSENERKSFWLRFWIWSMSRAAAKDGAAKAATAASAYTGFMMETILAAPLSQRRGLHDRGRRHLVPQHVAAARAPELVLLELLAGDDAGLRLPRAPGALDRDGIAVAEAGRGHRVLVVGAHEDQP